MTTKTTTTKSIVVVLYSFGVLLHLCDYIYLHRRPLELDTPDNFFIDTILNRHARLLLTAMRLRDLGKFSAHLEFALEPWLRKEKLVNVE